MPLWALVRKRIRIALTVFGAAGAGAGSKTIGEGALQLATFHISWWLLRMSGLSDARLRFDIMAITRDRGAEHGTHNEGWARGRRNRNAVY